MREAPVSALSSMPGSPCPTCGIVGWINPSGAGQGHCVVCDSRLRRQPDDAGVLDTTHE